MSSGQHADFAGNWKDIAASFLKLGVTAYGGPAIMGLMQAELQDKRQWVSKGRFLEGLSLVNVLPGAGATQLAIFLGYARGGWWGGLLAGLCFVLPAFFIMLALTMAYATLGVTPVIRGALYGLGPVVMGIFLMAVYRLGKSVVRTIAHAVIAMAAAAAMVWSPLGVAAILVLAGGVGLLLFYAKKVGIVVLLVLTAVLGILQWAAWSLSAPVAMLPQGTLPAADVLDIGMLFFKVGAFTFGGGLTMIAFLQDQVVNQLHWLTPQEFLDGLALSQFTPGPILMVAAYVGYKVWGVTGAVVGAAAIFLPSFLLLLAVLPVFDRVRALQWAQAAMQGVGPAVIGVLAVSLVHMAPHALPDPLAVAMLIATVFALWVWRLSAVKLMLTSAVIGILRSRLWSLPGVRAALTFSLGARG